MLDHLDQMPPEELGDYLYQKFRHHLQRGQFGLAEDLANHLRKQEEVDWQRIGQVGLSQVQYQRGRYAEAIAILDAWLLVYPDDEKVLLERATQHYNQDRLEAARRDAEQLYELDAKHAGAFNLLYQIATATENTELIARLEREATAEEPATDIDQIERWYLDGEDARADALLHEWLGELDMDTPEGFITARTVAEDLSQIGRWDKVETVLKMYLKDALDDESEERFLLCVALTEQERFQEALGHYDEPRKEVWNPQGRYIGALIHRSVGDTQKALALCKQALKQVDREDESLVTALENLHRELTEQVQSPTTVQTDPERASPNFIQRKKSKGFWGWFK